MKTRMAGERYLIHFLVESKMLKNSGPSVRAMPGRLREAGWVIDSPEDASKKVCGT